MKIALCLSGHYRSFDHTLESLQKHILNINPGIDIFFSTYRDIDHCNAAPISINGNCKPIDFIIESKRDFPESQLMRDKKIEPLRSIDGVLSMFYKIKSCNDLKSQYERDNYFIYDIVVRSRPDLLFKHDVIFDKLDGITTSKYGNFAGINDQFAYGSSRSMDIYCNMYDNINTVLEKSGIYFAPEVMLYKHIEMNNLIINKLDIDYDILRNPGYILNNKIREIEWGIIKN